ncbi:hypothetical protein H0H81_008597 [Sphagnurus paluster]|uniref:F-box domain-containing protein n=1 Tax=Sphagnurus paluster TaxID=117069 RepID=A0A9P7KGF8_9AGAR|nr:hypothetical protein H0H81_008597 [Sphagnurus paluster]
MIGITILGFPTEILLLFVGQLELSDVFNFLSACSSLRKLCDVPSLWISLLQRTKLRRKIACPTGTDLRNLQSKDLQIIARHTNRLEINWQSEAPRFLKPADFTLPDILTARHIWLLSVVPGTSMAILRAHGVGNKETLLLWPIGKPESLIMTIISAYSFVTFAFYHQSDRLLLACTTLLEEDVSRSVAIPQRLQIFSIFYESKFVELVYEVSVRGKVLSLGLSKDILAFIYSKDEDPPMYYLTTANYTTNRSLNVLFNPYSNFQYLGDPCLIVLDHKFLLAVGNRFTYDLHQFSPKALLLGAEEHTTPVGSLKNPITKVAHFRSPGGGFNSPIGGRPFVLMERMLWSPIGAYAIHSGRFILSQSAGHFYTTVHFWPYLRGAEELETTTRMCSDDARVTVELDGLFHQYAISHSGAYAVLSMGNSDASAGEVVQLLHFIRDPLHIDVRRITLPVCAAHNPPTTHTRRSLEIDDRKGVIYISHGSSQFRAVRFA